MSLTVHHEVRATETVMADGRQLIYFDDSPEYLSGEKSRAVPDPRDLPETSHSSEMRRDPLTGEWVAFAAHRMNRTFMPPANEDPLSPSKEGELPTEIPASDYDVVVFENRFPSFALSAELDDAAEFADPQHLVPRAPAKARCEVVCFTPQMDVSFKDLEESRIRTIIEVWAHRTKALSHLPGIKQVFPFENRGVEIGVTLQHPHGQIYSYPFLSPRAAAIAASVEQNPSLFDDLISSEVQDGRRVLVDGTHFLVFVPAAAKWPVEVMVLPKRQVPNFAELTDDEKAELAGLLKKLYTAYDKFFEGVEKTPYIAGWTQAPVEQPDRGRLHLDMFSLMRSPNRMKFLAGSESAQAVWISDTTPERIAERFREVWA